MLVSGICQKILVERLDKFPESWYISIIPPNMWLSLLEDKSREHRNVKYSTILNHDLFLDMVFSHLPLYF